jgi:uncharacterized protein
MSHIVVFGAGGKAGSRIVREAAGRGHQVTAVARELTKLRDLPRGVRVTSGDATDRPSVDALIKDSDAVVVAVGGPYVELYTRAVETITAAAAALGTPGRPYVVHMGGGSSLFDEEGHMHLHSDHFPVEYRPYALGQLAALEAYQESTGVSWTYMSPPPVHFKPGERLGRYRTGLDEPVAGPDGHSRISYEDFAVALLDEIEQPAHQGQRFTVGY